MRWIDTFLFNGDLVAKLRLAYLYPHVEKFYVVEQRYTYQGQRKEALFVETCKEWFEPYMDKVVFVIHEDLHPGSSWEREYAHREAVRPYLLKEAETPCLISVCDCDEIPDVSMVTTISDVLYTKCNDGILFMKHKFFYYNFNWYSGSTTDRAFFITDKHIRDSTTIQQFREGKGATAGMISCGWHFSYFMTAAEIRRKLESFAHTECNLDKFKAAEHVQRCIREGHDLFGRPMTFQRYTNPFPAEFAEFKRYLQSVQEE